jgi:hypothetical protein
MPTIGRTFMLFSIVYVQRVGQEIQLWTDSAGVESIIIA